MTVPTLDAPTKFHRIVTERGHHARGPTLIVVGGVHGNEPAGLLAAQRVAASLRDDQLLGRFVALAGNLQALNFSPPPGTPHPRYLLRDLNRAFTPELIARATARDELDAATKPDLELAEVRGLIEAIDDQLDPARPAILLDLHTVSAESPPFVAVEDALPAREFARSFGLPLILGIEEELPGLLMDWATNHRRCISMVIEGGRHDDPDSIDAHEAIITIALDRAAVAAIPPERLATARATLRRFAGRFADRIYDVRHRQRIEHPSFEMLAPARAFARVRFGAPLAREHHRLIEAPIPGVLFMPNRQPVRPPGDDGFFIIRPVRPVWLACSAHLRSSERLHRWLPRILPGVRRRPDHPHQILIAPRIASVLKRQVLHLLGYRILRHGREEHLSAFRRALRAITTTANSLATMLTGAFRGGERSILAAESPDDWIATRRTLDLPPPAHAPADTT
ncbi:MAG: succinylglutamate desuccinylase/aspartoacylase family protein [Phycisphaerales bacterium JB037]